MNRIAHAVFAGLLIAMALMAYGVKEQTSEMERAARALDREIGRLREEIAMLEVEWAHVTSAASLERLSTQLHGGPGLRDRDGEILEPWRPDQRVALAPAAVVDPSIADATFDPTMTEEAFLTALEDALQ